MESDQPAGPNPLFGVEVRHLAALATIARTRSFSRAGDELGYAQSAVSQQIAALERAVGHKLIDRPGGPKAVSLTPAGELLLRHAEVITARLAVAKADLDALSVGDAGVLYVGAFQSAEARLIPPTLARFRARFPKVEVKLHSEGSGEELDQLVLTGAVDLAFTEVSVVRHGLKATEILVDPYVALIPPGSPLSGRPAIDIADLRDQPMVGNTLTDYCSLRLARAFADARFEPLIVFRTDDNLTVQRLVGSGLGCAIVPTLAVEDELPGVVAMVRPLGPESAIERHVGLIWHADRDRTNSSAAFIEAAREVAAEESGRPRPWERKSRKTKART